MKISEIMPRFGGGVQVEAWFDQVNMAKELMGINDMSKVLPLFLTGDALAVLRQMDAADRNDENKIKDKLRKAFGIDEFTAYEEFTSRC